MTPKFIVFEGIDGAGKTTQIKLLAENLAKEGVNCYITAEPTDMPSGKIIREALSGRLPATCAEMADMFVRDRVIHNKDNEKGIDPHLERGVTVISDRYYYSSLAYQGQASDYAWVKAINLGCPEIRTPDICIYLDLTPEQSLARISGRGEAVEIYENVERLTAVRSAFLSVIDDLRGEGESIYVVNADRSPEDIASEILSIVTAKCGI